MAVAVEETGGSEVITKWPWVGTHPQRQQTHGNFTMNRPHADTALDLCPWAEGGGEPGWVECVLLFSEPPSNLA